MPVEQFTHGPLVRRLAGLGLSLGLAGAALLLLGRWAGSAAAAPTSAPSAIFTVNTTLDLPDNNLTTDHGCHIAPAGPCSLRAAIQQLDHDSGGSINLPAGTYVLTDTALGDLQLLQDIHIFGSGPGLSIVEGNPAGWAHRIFHVQSGANVLFSGLTISGGHPLAAFPGGGLYVASGRATVTDTVLINNSAGQGAGIYNSGTLVMNGGTLRGNHAFTEGAGLYNDLALGGGGVVSLTEVFVYSNTAKELGGGLYNTGEMAVGNSTIEANLANSGAGVQNALTGTLIITGSTLVANYASDGYGAGLSNRGAGSVTQMANSTVAANHGTYFGAGVADVQGAIDLSSVTVAGNTMFGNGAGGGLYAAAGQTFSMRNTLVAENVDVTGVAPDCSGTFHSNGYNLVQSTLGCTLTNPVPSVLATNITGHDPELQPLGYWGGPTVTIALNYSSPALDAGNPAGCRFGLRLLTIDQRGRPRAADGNGDGVARCDIGAFELQLNRLFAPLLAR